MADFVLFLAKNIVLQNFYQRINEIQNERTNSTLKLRFKFALKLQFNCKINKIQNKRMDKMWKTETKILY